MFKETFSAISELRIKGVKGEYRRTYQGAARERRRRRVCKVFCV